MEILTVLLFAFAVSADGFVAGMAYGINKIKIPVISLAVIASASACAVSVSMACGKGLSAVLPASWSSKIGAIILVVIGLYFLLQACREKINSIENDGEETLFTLNLRSFGLIVQIYKEPSCADLDCSGEINFKEAFFLGFALALDALGAGIGVAMTGLNIFFTALSVGVLKFILVNCGIFLGEMMSSKHFKSTSSLAAGIIFIVIAIFELT